MICMIGIVNVAAFGCRGVHVAASGEERVTEEENMVRQGRGDVQRKKRKRERKYHH